MPDLHSRFFTLDELTRSQTATRKGLRNTPNRQHVAALNQLCLNVLDPLRVKLNRPVNINSGYRSLLLNWHIGGSATSQHCKGEAVDLVVPGVDLKEVLATIVASNLPFDQLIFEGTWLHLSHKFRGEQRGQMLQAEFKPGRTVYKPLRL
jgi:hypothetical protein